MIKITKRVSLAFLGDGYEDSYITVEAIPMKDIDDLQVRAKEAEGKQSIKFLQDELTSRFVDGKIAQDGKLTEVTKEDLGDLPIDVFTEVFKQMSGQTDLKS